MPQAERLAAPPRAVLRPLPLRTGQPPRGRAGDTTGGESGPLDRRTPAYCSSTWRHDCAAGAEYPAGMVRCEACHLDVPPIYFALAGVCWDCALAGRRRPRQEMPAAAAAGETAAAIARRHPSRFAQVLAMLTPHQRAALDAHYLRGAAAADVARRTGRDASTVSRMLSRIRAAFVAHGLPAPHPPRRANFCTAPDQFPTLAPAMDDPDAPGFFHAGKPADNRQRRTLPGSARATR